MSCATFECHLRRSTAIGRNSDYEVYLSWNPSQNPNTSGFRILRNNIAITTLNKTAISYTDITVNLEQTLTYKLQELVGGKVIDQSVVKYIITPSYNPFEYNSTDYKMQPPTNLANIAVLYQNNIRNKLTWTAVPEAERYNIYRYERLIGTTTDNFFYIPDEFFIRNITYVVTSVNIDGIESFPSAPVIGRAYADGLPMPSGIVDAARNIRGYSEINNGNIRNLLFWARDFKGDEKLIVDYWNVYKDGVLKAEGLYVQYFIDNDPTPGKKHSYVIEGVIQRGETKKSTINPAYEITTLSNTNIPSPGTVEIISVKPNDDSLIVKFKKYPGAKDYRVRILNRDTMDDMRVGGNYWGKYSGGNDVIQVNGVGPNTTATLVIEALDKLGPFVRMDGFDGPGQFEVYAHSYSGAHETDHDHEEAITMGNHRGIASMEMVNAEVNGQGDPSNVPNIIASSSEFTGTTLPFQFTGEQQFFENWRSVKPFHFVQSDDSVIKARKYPGNYTNYFALYENDKWQLFFDAVDTIHTQFFWMADHMMTTVFDGGTLPVLNAAHVANAIMMTIPKTPAQISGNRVLHATFEVDPHFTNRRWIDILIYDSNDTLINGQEKATNLTTSNNTLRWSIKADGHFILLSKIIDGEFTLFPVDKNISTKSREVEIYKSRHFTNHTDKNKYKIGEFTVVKILAGPADNPTDMIIRHNFFAADGRFTPKIVESRVIFNPTKGFGTSNTGTIFQKDFTPANFNMQIEPNFTAKKPNYVDATLKYILDAFNNSVPFGLITYERKSGPTNTVLGIQGNIYYKPGPEDDNLAANKNDEWYDNRIKFDIYLSKNRVAILENNYLVNDAQLPFELPFESLKICFNHLVYHSSLELSGNFRFRGGDNYHAYYRPYADERHWDNMGYEVLSSFPNLIAPENTLDTY